MPDEPEAIAQALQQALQAPECQLVLFTGGTGLAPRDRTAEVLQAAFEAERSRVWRVVPHAFVPGDRPREHAQPSLRGGCGPAGHRGPTRAGGPTAGHGTLRCCRRRGIRCNRSRRPRCLRWGPAAVERGPARWYTRRRPMNTPLPRQRPIPVGSPLAVVARRRWRRAWRLGSAIIRNRGSRRDP
ncbi:MAG: molybdopterin-binding protein [Planctomycetota bacterium]